MLLDILNKASTVAMLSFVVSSMLAMGTGLTVRQIVEPLRNARLVMLALLANFILMPLGAFALAKVLWLDEPFGVGLLLLGCAAGAPFLPKLAELAKGNLAINLLRGLPFIRSQISGVCRRKQVHQRDGSAE